MLGGKFKNRMSVIKRDSVRKESLKGPGGNLGNIKEDEEDNLEKILENVEDFEDV